LFLHSSKKITTKNIDLGLENSEGVKNSDVEAYFREECDDRVTQLVDNNVFLGILIGIEGKGGVSG
jgi:hypothetical protein